MININTIFQGCYQRTVSAYWDKRSNQRSRWKACVLHKRRPHAILIKEDAFVQILHNQFPVANTHKTPLRGGCINSHCIIAVLKYFSVGPEKHCILIQAYIPYIIKRPLLLWNKVEQGMILQPACGIRHKVAQLILATHINSTIFSNFDSSNNGAVRKRIQMPKCAIKAQ